MAAKRRGAKKRNRVAEAKRLVDHWYFNERRNPYPELYYASADLRSLYRLVAKLLRRLSVEELREEIKWLTQARS